MIIQVAKVVLQFETQQKVSLSTMVRYHYIVVDHILYNVQCLMRKFCYTCDIVSLVILIAGR